MHDLSSLIGTTQSKVARLYKAALSKSRWRTALEQLGRSSFPHAVVPSLVLVGIALPAVQGSAPVETSSVRVEASSYRASPVALAAEGAPLPLTLTDDTSSPATGVAYMAASLDPTETIVFGDRVTD